MTQNLSGSTQELVLEIAVNCIKCNKDVNDKCLFYEHNEKGKFVNFSSP